MSHCKGFEVRAPTFASWTCAIGKPVPQAVTYVIEPPPVSDLKHGRETLRMGKVRVATAFAGRSLVLRMDDARYSTDFLPSLYRRAG
jgi:uncharacterized lipoprotein YmbA